MCLDQGFEVSIYSTKRSHDLHCIELRCKNLAKARKKGAGEGRRKSLAPASKEQCCPFKFVVYYHVVHERFFVRKDSPRHLHHLNHTPLARSDRSVRHGYNMDPYARLHPLFANAMDHIRSDEQLRAASEKLQEMFQIVLKLGEDENNSGDIGPTTEVSVPFEVGEPSTDGAVGAPVALEHREQVIDSFPQIYERWQHKRKRPIGT